MKVTDAVWRDDDRVGGVGGGVGGGFGDGVLDGEGRRHRRRWSTPEMVVIVEEPPHFASVTVLPAIRCDCASLRVTVIVEVVTPSATREVGEAVTVDCAGSHRAGREVDRGGLGDGHRVGRVGRGVGGRLDRRVLDRERRDAGGVRRRRRRS